MSGPGNITPGPATPSALELIVPYKQDNLMRAANKDRFLEYWQDYTVTIVDDYQTRATAYNSAAQSSNSEYIALADIDAIIPYHQMQCQGDVTYPYSHVANIHDFTVTDHSYSALTPWPNYYVYGLMVIFKRSAFLKFGGENTDFKGWGWEDFERYHRALNHNFTVNRIAGPAYHMEHGGTRRVSNQHIEHNYNLMNLEREKYERKIFT